VFYFLFFSNFLFTEIFSFQNGLAFTLRRGRYDIFFGKENSFWQIRHPLIVNQWFDATLTWTPNDGLKFYVNGELVASDTTPEQFNLTLANEPFKLMIGSAENGGGWSRAISIGELKVWKTAMGADEIKRQSEGRFPMMTSKSPKHNNRKCRVTCRLYSSSNAVTQMYLYPSISCTNLSSCFCLIPLVYISQFILTLTITQGTGHYCWIVLVAGSFLTVVLRRRGLGPVMMCLAEVSPFFYSLFHLFVFGLLFLPVNTFTASLRFLSAIEVERNRGQAVLFFNHITHWPINQIKM